MCVGSDVDVLAVLHVEVHSAVLAEFHDFIAFPVAYHVPCLRAVVEAKFHGGVFSFLGDGVSFFSRCHQVFPVFAFDFLDSEYAFTLEWERDGKACVRLTPTDGSNAASGEVTLTVDTASMRPLSLAYDYDGERVDISVEAIEPNADTYRAFDRKACDGYEFIDFR